MAIPTTSVSSKAFNHDSTTYQGDPVEEVDDSTLQYQPASTWSRFHSIVSLILLFSTFFLAQYDRFILSYFQLSITEELRISSSQYGILSGYATGISFAVLSVPLAFISDRALARVWTLTACTIWWSLCVIFQGLSRRYWQLVCARVGMGIGQSAVEALSVSLISDIMGPRQYVATGEAVLYVGIYIGEAISGQISTAFRKTGTSWRWAMIGVGIFGIGVGIVLRLVIWREPRRADGLVDRDPGAMTVKSGFKLLKRTIERIARMHSFWLFTLSAGVRTLAGVVFGYYMPGYLQQLYPESTNIMSTYGLIVGVVGSVAALSGGLTTSLLWQRTKLTPLYLVSIGGVLSSAFVIIMVFSRHLAGGSESRGLQILYGSMAAAYITAELWLAPVNGLLVLMLPPEFKTLAFSIYSAISVLIYSSGPEIVGLALQGVSPSSAQYVTAIKTILAVIIPVGYVLSSIGFALCLPLAKRDLGLVCTVTGETMRMPVSPRRKLALLTGFTTIIVMVVILFIMNLVYGV